MSTRWAIPTTGSTPITAAASPKPWPTNSAPSSRSTPRSSRNTTPTSISASAKPRKAGTLRWRPTRAARSSPITAPGPTSANASVLTCGIRGAQTRHPAQPRPLARPDQPDEAGRRQADPGGALLRPAHAQFDRLQGRRPGGRHDALGRRKQGNHQLLPTLRLRHQPAGQHVLQDEIETIDGYFFVPPRPLYREPDSDGHSCLSGRPRGR